MPPTSHASRSQLEHYAAQKIVGAALSGRPVEVSRLVHDQAGLGECAVGAIGLGAKAVKDRVRAAGRQLEHRAITAGAASMKGRAVEEGSEPSAQLDWEQKL